MGFVSIWLRLKYLKSAGDQSSVLAEKTIPQQSPESGSDTEVFLGIK